MSKQLTSHNWLAKLRRKTYQMCAWDWKEPPWPFIKLLFKPFGVRLTLKGVDFDEVDLERLVAALASKCRLHVYEAPSLEGSDTFGFVLSKEKLDKRELQQIEADYFGEDFGEVYGGHIASVRAATELRVRIAKTGDRLTLVRTRTRRRSRDGWVSGALRTRFRNWRTFRSELTRLMKLLSAKKGRFVIIQGEGDTYVCFKSYPRHIRGETPADNRVVGRALNRVGWNSLISEGTSYQTINWQTWPRSAIDPPITLALDTFRCVHRLDGPDKLSIACLRGSTAGTRRAGSNLSPGVVVIDAASERRYRVVQKLGEGGFATAYEVTVIGERGNRMPDRVCLKVADKPEAWHREAYFGQLLAGQPRAVAVYDSFACVDPSLADGKPLYCLVMEMAEFGNLTHYFELYPKRWSDAHARREIVHLLRLMLLLHKAGAVHRDLTPQNILVAGGRVLKLADFGLARHRSGMRGVPADAFNPGFVASAMAKRNLASWRASDDVYQLGQLFAMLLTGSANFTISPREVALLTCSAESKAIIQRAIGERRKRWSSAEEMVNAFEPPRAQDLTHGSVDSLNGKVVVFTGLLAEPRSQAARLAKQGGGRVKTKVGSDTDIVVLGSRNPGYKAGDKGQKLLDVDRERERGHDIVTITEERFERLVAVGRQKRQSARKRRPS